MARAARVAAFALLAALVGACGPARTSAPSAGPTGVPASATPPGSPGPSSDVDTLRIYLVLGFGSTAGIVPVLRPGDPGPRPADVALAALLAGPNEAEGAARPAPYTAIPPGTQLLGLTLDGSVATVDLSREFESTTDDGLPTMVRVAQVVYTVTADEDVSAVRLAIEGQVVTAVGPDHFAIDGPLDRVALTDALPPVFMDEPAWGATITSPVHIAGLANAFEAVLQVRIADAEGRGLASGPVTASCGTGCWGDYAVDVPFSVAAPGPGVVQAFELSAKDGAMVNLREHPVWLVP